MRIQKKSIKADAFIDETLTTIPEAAVEEVPLLDEPNCYDSCIEYIHQAIDCLATCASTKDDPTAKEAIANLSVILLDLQK